MVYTQKVSLMLTEFNSRTGRICSIYTIAYFAVVILSWSSFSQRSHEISHGAGSASPATWAAGRSFLSEWLEAPGSKVMLLSRLLCSAFFCPR